MISYLPDVPSLPGSFVYYQGQPIVSSLREPGQKYTRLLDQVFPPAVEQFGGYLLITADVQVIGWELFGSQDMDFIAAVPAHALN